MKSDEARSFIFESADARTADKLIVIIHGSGVVRAGQWSRRSETTCTPMVSIINYSLCVFILD